jgi:hypothetical protein
MKMRDESKLNKRTFSELELLRGIALCKMNLQSVKMNLKTIKRLGIEISYIIKTL